MSEALPKQAVGSRAVMSLAAMLPVLLGLGGCGIFGGGDDEKELEPAPLVRFTPRIEVDRAWSTRIGGDAEFLRLGLRPAGDGTRIYAASHDGNVVALNPENGRPVWRNELDVALSGGPGAGEGLVVVGAADGVVIALDSGTGEESWRAGVAGEVLAPPLVRGDVVVVLNIDNILRGLSAFDGSERWQLEQSTPRLTMRGSAAPVAVGTTVVAGFDNGRVLAADLLTGDVEWELMLSPPSGRSDLERLADIEGLISVVGQDVYAAGYQGRVAAIASESGQVLWAREISTYEGVSADWNNVYTVNDQGEVIAMSRRTGNEVWRNNSLLRREPTVPVSFGTTVAVGDLEGYVHFFSNVDGEPAARVRVDSSAISSDPVVIGNRLIVQSDSGTVAAYEIDAPRRRPAVPDVAEDGAQ